MPGTSVDIEVSLGIQMVTVPDVVGQVQATAEGNIVAASLVVGTVTTSYSATVPEGNVISQNPAGGASVVIDSSVGIEVSLGVEPVTVPDVVGLSQATAESNIVAATLTVGAVTTDYSMTVAAGYVISQTPAGGSSELPGTLVDIVVSLGIEMVTVPDVVGLTQAPAEASIVAAGLDVGSVTTLFSETVPEGDVISQNPTSGSSVEIGSNVHFVVSLGLPPAFVPNVVGLTQAAAQADIVAVGLVVGTVSTSYSFTVPAGDVISQNPAGGALVDGGSSVNIEVSLGVEMVTVPSVVGQAQATAQSNIVATGLVVGTVTTSYNAVVPAGDVISQSPVGSTSVEIGSSVGIEVSLGVEMVTVPSVVGQAQATAQSNIVAANLVVGTVTTSYSFTVPAGDVISQSPTGGSSAQINSSVDIEVSLGIEQVVVPNVVTQDKVAAIANIEAAQLFANVIEVVDAAPVDQVISQSPTGGASVDISSTVDITVSLGLCVAIPDVVGMLEGAAVAVLNTDHVSGGSTASVNDASPAGTVLTQSAVGGCEGGAFVVTYTVSTGPAIPVTNHSFESPNIASGSVQTGAPGWTYSGSGGIWDRNSGGFAGVVTATPDASDAEQIAYVAGANATLHQVTGTNLVAGATYRLRVDVSHWGGSGFNATILKLGTGASIGTNYLSSTVVANTSPPEGGWSTWETTFTVGSGVVGQALRIELVNGSNNYQTQPDNVRLERY